MVVVDSSMLGVLILGAHLVGDFMLQTNYMAMNKLAHWQPRALHVTAYTLPFALLFIFTNLTWPHYGELLALIWVTLFISDSRRWVKEGPWPPKAIMIDQTIHVVTLGILGAAFGL